MINWKNWLSAGIILAALLLIPSYGATYFNGTIKCIGITCLVLLFGVRQFWGNKEIEIIDSTDLSWLGLIGFTGLSIIWSVNEIYAVYGLFTTLILYLTYKVFQSLEWDEKTEWIIRGVLLFCFIIAVGLQTYLIRHEFMGFNAKKDAVFVQGLGDVNHHWLGSLMVVLLPYLIFKQNRFSKISSPIFLIVVLGLTAVSGSAQVMIAGFLLSIIYLFYWLKIPIKKVAYWILGISFIGLIGLWIINYTKGDLRGLTFVLDEFYQQDDRFWMWEGSLKLFAEAPLTGFGKNNWELVIGNWGYENCLHCNKYEFQILRYAHAHNAVFQLLSELGIFGGLFYLGIGVFPVLRLFKNQSSLKDLEIAALVSLLLFVFCCLMYGIVYNYYDHFQGMPVVAVLSLAILHKRGGNQPIFKLKPSLFYGFFIVLSCSALFFFSKHLIAKKQFYFANQDSLSRYNLGEAEFKYLQALNYWHPAKVYRHLGQLYQKLDRPELQRLAYQNAIKKDPNDLLLHYEYGKLLYEQNQYKLALKESEYVHKGSSKLFQNQVLLMYCYRQTNQLEKAEVLEIKIEQKIKLEREQENWRMGNRENKGQHNEETEIERLLKEFNKTTDKNKLPNPLITKQLNKLPQLPKIPNKNPLVFIDVLNGQSVPSNKQPISLKLTKYLEVQGWAADGNSKELAGGIFIELAGEFYRATYLQKRQDVAAALQNPNYTQSGFSGFIPFHKIPKGIHTLKVWIVSSDLSTLFIPEDAKNVRIEVK